MNHIKGKIHSFQTLGARDGPGIRFVVFMQGCSLRCNYCHNPDTWQFSGYEAYTVQEVVQRILRYKDYFNEKGGVTVTGGEPLLQPEFVRELFCELRKNGIGTALDTCGIYTVPGYIKPSDKEVTKIKRVLEVTSLIICDLKYRSDQEYNNFCKGKLENVIEFLEVSNEMRIPLWIRHVAIPGLTDSQEYIRDIYFMVNHFGNLKKFEILPFSGMCKSKYEKLGLPFLFEGVKDKNHEDVLKLYPEEYFIQYNI